MKAGDIFREKLEQSNDLYHKLLKSSRELDANLSRWSAVEISAYQIEAQKLQNKIKDLDRESREMRDTVPAGCRELISERAKIIREILPLLEKNKVVISRMLAMLSDDLSRSKNFRNAAEGYFRKSRTTGRTLARTA